MSRKAISAKLDEGLLREADSLARRFKVARNRAVEEGLRLWVRRKSRELLALRMKQASLAARKESRRDADAWSVALGDGLDDL